MTKLFYREGVTAMFGFFKRKKQSKEQPLSQQELVANRPPIDEDSITNITATFTQLQVTFENDTSESSLQNTLFDKELINSCEQSELEALYDLALDKMLAYLSFQRHLLYKDDITVFTSTLLQCVATNPLSIVKGNKYAVFVDKDILYDNLYRYQLQFEAFLTLRYEHKKYLPYLQPIEDRDFQLTYMIERFSLTPLLNELVHTELPPIVERAKFSSNRLVENIQEEDRNDTFYDMKEILSGLTHAQLQVLHHQIVAYTAFAISSYLLSDFPQDDEGLSYIERMTDNLAIRGSQHGYIANPSTSYDVYVQFALDSEEWLYDFKAYCQAVYEEVTGDTKQTLTPTYEAIQAIPTIDKRLHELIQMQ